MQVQHTREPIANVEADAVVVGLYQDQPPLGPAAELDQAAGGLLTRLQERKELTGERYQVVPLHLPPGITAPLAVVVGLGDVEDLDRGVAFRATAAATKHLAAKQRNRVAVYCRDELDADLAEAAVAGAISGMHGQDLYRQEKRLHPCQELLFSVASPQSIETGRIIGDAVLLARNLVNEPPGMLHPQAFAERAGEIAQVTTLELKVWDKHRLEQERCGALLGVARGSAREPRLVILRHHGGDKDSPTLVLVGKGVTFDSGGYSLKPGDSMKTMKCDMAGAAAVLGAMQAIAQLKLPVNVLGLMGMVENLVSGSAYKLGDVLTARNGKTIEVLNTDAEGRLVLADALCVANDLGASHIVDLATLTGACMVALGTDVAGLMTNNESWCDTVADAADLAGEPAWELPMFDEYGEEMKSEVADLKNVGAGRWGGAITAAKFLENFVDDTPWTHIDIAGPAYCDSAKAWQDAGGSGAFVRTLIELARNYDE